MCPCLSHHHRSDPRPYLLRGIALDGLDRVALTVRFAVRPRDSATTIPFSMHHGFVNKMKPKWTRAWLVGGKNHFIDGYQQLNLTGPRRRNFFLTRHYSEVPDEL